MSEAIVHNGGDSGSAPQSAPGGAISVSSKCLPRTITLELEDGTRKEYRLVFTQKSKGLILNKAV
jgi:hypothetical protein